MTRKRVEKRPSRPPMAKPRTADRRAVSTGSDRQSSENVVFGVAPVLEMLKARPRSIESIFIADEAREARLREITEAARENSIVVNRVPRAKLAKMLDGANTQGVVAITSAAEYADPDSIFAAAGNEALVLVLDGIEDPRNLGAIIRTAECAGVHGVFLPERRAVGLTDSVAKTSAGATAHTRIAKVPNINRLIEDLKSRGIWVVGASMKTEMSYTEWDWKTPSALVLGSEGAGLHRLVAENCDALVKIPMYGKISSLNVSVAAGVILFEACRQRYLK